ncbi:MAG: restriction endonuclease subunit S [Clostridia bacterium]|nr:restriction endonuclease subunit S [Clostridia bacterium]
MGLSKLGSFLELVDIRNTDGALSEESVVGISTQKEFISTKADLDGVNLSSYKIVPPKHFAYVPDTSRRGDKMSLAFNTSENSYLVSAITFVFRVCKPKELLSDYLFMYFNRPEFDRYARFNSWGSARETFSWEDMCDIKIDLPPLPIQQKYVNVYRAMLTNQRAYERGLGDLNNAIAATLEKFKHTAPRIAVGTLLEEIDVRNSDGAINNVQGININKEFMPSVANLSETDLTKYKVIYKNQFAYSAMQTGRDECIRIALYHEDEPAIISPAYSVLQVKNGSALAEYIMLWFSRSESDRYGWFISDSSIRASLELTRFYEIEIPLPSLFQQQAIVNFYNARHLMLRNISTLSTMLKDICPILIKGSLEEAKSA